MNIKKDKKWTMKEIADLKGCSKQSVQQMAVRHKIKGRRLGPMRYFTEKEAQVLIQSVAVKGQKTGGRKVVAALIAMMFIVMQMTGCGRDEAYANATKGRINDDDAVYAIFGEARNQSLDGMTAVGEVIRRRGSLKGFEGLIAAKEGIELGLMPNTKSNRDAFEMAVIAWKRSEHTNLSCGATLFENIYAFGFPKSWDREKVICVAQIGDHWFFKEIGA